MLRRLWQENEPVFRAIVGAAVRDASKIDDILQDAYLRLLDKGYARRSDHDFRYVRRVIVNTACDHGRRTRRRLVLLVRKHEFRRSPPPTPLQVLVREQEQRLRMRVLREIRLAAARLSSEKRMALEIYYGDNTPCIREVCRHEGIPYSTLRSRMLAAVRDLRKHLKRSGLYQAYENILRLSAEV